ncbi:hypothetical protein QVD17_25080 [Tagetes erecta]|uniref:Uncharacterized protein n=1 Tax=Tagetes erecta TaxID=13708 RepID=A0AAD8KG46_TARER|nr:hypothetical protein QVD17_25080 [Tagetes erecta]
MGVWYYAGQRLAIEGFFVEIDLVFSAFSVQLGVSCGAYATLYNGHQRSCFVIVAGKSMSFSRRCSAVVVRNILALISYRLFNALEEIHEEDKKRGKHKSASDHHNLARPIDTAGNGAVMMSLVKRCMAVLAVKRCKGSTSGYGVVNSSGSVAKINTAGNDGVMMLLILSTIRT